MPLVIFVKQFYVDDVSDNFSSHYNMTSERLLSVPKLQNVNDKNLWGLISSNACFVSTEVCPRIPWHTVWRLMPCKGLTTFSWAVGCCKKKLIQHAAEIYTEKFERLARWFLYKLSRFRYKWSCQKRTLYTDNEIKKSFCTVRCFVKV